jgi:hypothetical protein
LLAKYVFPPQYAFPPKLPCSPNRPTAPYLEPIRPAIDRRRSAARCRGGGVRPPTATATAVAASQMGSVILGAIQQLQRQQWQHQPTPLMLSLSTKGGQCRSNNVPPPTLLIPSASAKVHAPPGNLDRSKVASRIITPSVASCHIFGGGQQGGGDGGKQQQGWGPS